MKRYFYQALFFVCAALFGAVFLARTVFATTTCNISSNTTINATYVNSNTCDVIALTGTPTITWSGTIDTDQAVLVQVNSGTVVFSGALVLGKAESSVTVASGATVTHAAEDKTGVQITAPTVTVTGSINTDSKGCAANKGVNGTGDCATGNAGTPGNNYSGGAHGGAGGSGYFTAVNTGTYGSSTNPTLLGSGGGASGRAGGGRVGLTVSGVLTITGSVTANGGTGGDLTPGGSGGSIYVKAATLDGEGTITSNGGAGGGGCGRGGEGGGGRIAIYYDAGTFGFTNASKITVTHGTGGCNDSKNGTTFILNRQTDDGAGTLTFNGGGVFAAGVDYVRDTITVVSGSYLTCDASLTSLTVSSTNALVWPSSTWVCSPTAATSLSIGSNSTISITSLAATFAGTMGAVKVEGASLTTSGMTWSLSGASSLALNVASFSNSLASTLTMSKAGSYTTFNTTGALTLNNFTYTGGTAGTASGETGGHLIIPRNIDLTLTNGKIFANVSSTLASVSIDSTSQIGANGKGCLGNTGPNSSNVCTTLAAGSTDRYGGAGHGGTGGTGYFAVGGASYGSSTYPVLFGSGAGYGVGAGGGRVWLTVTGLLTNNGLITANAGSVGGSGGSIYINAATFAGTGNVSSTGAVGDGNVGCGAGGRIAMISSSFTFSGTSSTAAGATSCTGAAGVGTIYKLAYVIPTTPSFSAPVSGIYNALRTPTLVASTYANSPYLAQINTDWKVTTDSGGSSTVWSSLADASNFTTTVVDSSHGTFAGVLAGQSALAASSTYYAFVRYRNLTGPSSWSTSTTFTTAYAGASSTKTFDFSDTTSTDAFTYDSTYVQVNASSNGYAHMKDLGSSTYGFSLAYPSTYTRVKKLTITNQVASVLTDFQTKVTVTYDADMQSDFDDIRFTSSDGITNIPFWLESKTNGSSAIFYVKVPSLPASGTSTVYMYYGDATVASGSSGTSTFLFFDDFNDGDINGWTSFAAESGAVAPLVTAASSALRINGSASSNMEGGAVYGGYTFTNGIYEADVTLNTYLVGQETHMFARMSSIGANPNGYRFGPLWAGANDLNLAREAGHYNLTNTSYTYGAGVSRKMSFTLSGSSLKGSMDGTQYLTTTDANYSSGYLGFVIDARHESQTAMQSTIDNVRVRQYVATEPSISTGSEVTNIGFTAASIITIDNGSLADYAHLYRMEETLIPGSTGSVSYQLSANGTTWKYWDGSAWSTASASFSQTNSSSTLNSYLPLFGAQVGSGRLYVRIVLSSNGTQPVGLDALTFYYLLSNVAPSVPASLGSSTLVDGSTTSTNTPLFSFALSDTDVVDTLKYQIQIDDASDFSSPAVDYTSALAAQGARTFQVGQAVGGGSYAVGAQGQTLSDGSYYWRAKTFDNGGLSSSYVTATTGTAAFVVDTATRTIQFASTTATGAESVGSITIPIVLNQSHFLPVSVAYTVTAGTAEAGGVDFTIATGTATIATGQTSTTVSVTMIDDAIPEPNETFTISLSSPTNASLGAGSDFVYTITDNDTAGVTISQSSGSTAVAEGGATDSFTVELTAQPTSTVQISLATSTSGVTLSSGAISFNDTNWNVPQTVTVSATDDQIHQGTHTGTITPSITMGGYGFIDLTLTPFTATITDNDVAGVTITESSGSTAVTEGGVTDSFTVVLTAQPTSTVQVLFATSTSGVTLSHASVSFDSTNWSTPQTVTVTAVDDEIYQGTHTGTITPSITSSALGFSSIVLSPFSATITDNDTAGLTVTVSSGPLAATEGGATDSFTVVLTSQPTSTVEIILATSTNGVRVSSGRLSFDDSNWSTPQTVNVTATNDEIAEGDHTGIITFSLEATAYGYEDLILDASTVAITDNDSAGVTITQSSGSTRVTEGGATDTLTAVLTSEPTSTIRLTITTSTTDISLSTTTLDFTDANWSTPQTVTVSAVNDLVFEGSQTSTLAFTISQPSGTSYGYADLDLSALAVEVTDNDEADVILSKTALEVSEAGDTDAYTLVLGSQPTSTVMISFASSDQITLSTSTILFTSSNWNTPVSVSASAVDDLVAEGSHEAFFEQVVSSNAHGYDQLTLADMRLAIEDNDAAGVTFSTSTVQAAEGDYPGAYTIVLVSPPTSTVRVLVTPETGLTVSTSSIAFTASNWNIPVEVIVYAVDDTVAQGTRTAHVSHALSSSAAGYDTLVLPRVSVVIEDNDRKGSSEDAGGGGGGGGGGAAVGPVTPVSSLAPAPVPAQSPSKVPPPVIIVLPAPGEVPTPPPVLLPNQAVVTVLNPSDIVSLVQATNGGRNIESEGKNLTLIQKDATEFSVPLKNANALTLTNFITYGISERTRALGEGERRALVRDAFETMKTSVIATTDLERLARGMVPEYRNIVVERKQLPRVRSTFKVIFGHDPNFKNADENLAWNTLMYRIRFERNLTAEKQGIVAFKKTFKKNPEQPFQWATVRVMGYIKK